MEDSRQESPLGKLFRRQFRKNLGLRRISLKIFVVLLINIKDCFKNLTSDTLWEAFLTSSPLPLRFACPLCSGGIATLFYLSLLFISS